MKSYIYKILFLDLPESKGHSAMSRINFYNGFNFYDPKNPDSGFKKIILTLFLLLTTLTIVNISCVSSKSSKADGIVTPVNLARLVMTDKAAQLEWTINYDEDFKEYRVYRSAKPNVSVNSDSKMIYKASERYKVTCGDSGLEPGTKYYYKILSYNDNNEYALSNEAWGETPLGPNVVQNGEITADTVWTTAMSPIVVKGDVTVKSGVKLTIDPGVTVRLSANDMQAGGGFVQKSEIIVKGTLKAEGSVDKPILFISNERYNTAGDWGGIRFESASGGSNNSLKYCKIMHSSIGIYIYKTNAVLENLQISHTLNYGIITEGSGSPIRYSQINDVGQSSADAAAIYSKSTPNPHIYNCVLGFTSGNGVFIESGMAVVDHNIIAECEGAGVVCQSESLDMIVNNAIFNNTAGIRNLGAVTTEFKPDFNNLYNMPGFDRSSIYYSGCTAGANSISAHPKYVNPDFKYPNNADFTLESVSPMKGTAQSGHDMGLDNPLNYGVKY
ncbi:MAG TPA: hypothetical protein DC017_18680 [Candidatus Wallbacteria bacterium]|nr:hypothetical protein [Candidatus Wallbacteria bacterium]